MLFIWTYVFNGTFKICWSFWEQGCVCIRLLAPEIVEFNVVYINAVD